MKDHCLMRIFIGESDRFNGRPLYEVIVDKARQLRLAGATVFRGIMGFGAESHMHSAKFVRLSEDLPIVIEIVEEESRLEDFLNYLDEVVKEGIVTIERVRVRKYPGQ